MEIINSSELNEVRKLVSKLKKDKKKIVVLAQSDDFNRKILEMPEVDILLGPEMHDRKDFLKQRDSGMNEVLCRIAKKNDIKIAINLPAIIRLPKKEKAIALSRVYQNIRLCKKSGTKLIVFPDNYSKQAVLSLFLALKASSEQAKKAF